MSWSISRGCSSPPTARSTRDQQCPRRDPGLRSSGGGVGPRRRLRISVAAYSPGPSDRKVDEKWPTHGWPAAAYPREKAYLERWLDTYETRHPSIRVVRMRPGFIFKRESATSQRRLFLGPLLPRRLVRPDRIPLVPFVNDLRVQVLHTEDAAAAYAAAVVNPVHGAFNLAAEPPVTVRSSHKPSVPAVCGSPPSSSAPPWRWAGTCTSSPLAGTVRDGPADSIDGLLPSSRRVELDTSTFTPGDPRRVPARSS